MNENMTRIAVALTALALCFAVTANAARSLSIKKAGLWYWTGDLATNAIKAPGSPPKPSPILHDGVTVYTVGCRGMQPSKWIESSLTNVYHRFRCTIQGQNSAGASVHFGVTLVATGRRSATATVR